MKNNTDIIKVLIAFFIIYFVWGSTYLANAWAVESIPPFMLAGSRFFFAGALILTISGLRYGFSFSSEEIKASLFSGFMLFTLGNGMLVWTLKVVDSGIVALMVAFEPLIVVLMMWWMRNARPGWNSWVGVVLGILGMGFLAGQPAFVSDIWWILSVVCIIAAISCWAYISIWIKDAKLPKSVFQSSGLQMLLGGFSCLIVSVMFQEHHQIEFAALNKRVVLSMVYLILFGSVIAFTAFNFLLKRVSPTKVVTCTYVNPVVAMLLGYYLNNEYISNQSVFAAVLLLTGVVFINGHIPGIQFLRRSKKA